MVRFVQFLKELKTENTVELIGIEPNAQEVLRIVSEVFLYEKDENSIKNVQGTKRVCYKAYGAQTVKYFMSEEFMKHLKEFEFIMSCFINALSRVSSVQQFHQSKLIYESNLYIGGFNQTLIDYTLTVICSCQKLNDYQYVFDTKDVKITFQVS